MRRFHSTTISANYEITLTKEFCDEMGWQPGQRLKLIVVDGLAHLVPIRSIEELKGIAKGASMEGYREEEDEERWP